MRLGAIAIMALAMAGCGGGGGGQSGTPSVFVGNYAGTWQSDELSMSGTAVVTVGQYGKVTGTITNTTLDQDASLQGQVANDGSFSGSTTYPDLAAVPATGTFTQDGTTLTSRLTQTASGNQYHVDITLTKQ